MERAEDIREFRRLKREQKIKENAELVNKELLEFEKVLNKYKNDTDDKNPYITLPTLIKTEEVKSLLKDNGYIIDKISNDIEINTTRIFLNDEEYDTYIKKNCYFNRLNNNTKIEASIKDRNTYLSDKQKEFLMNQGYYPLKEDYFDMVKKITNMLREKGEC